MKEINKMKKKNRLQLKLGRRTDGVTMMETIVAIGVLVLGIVTALSLMAASLAFSQSSEQSIVVVNLAREGIEIVRSIRDLNRSFDQSPISILTNGDYIVGADGDLVLTPASFYGGEDISNCTNCYLYLSGGKYVHSGLDNEITIFRRLITISDEVAGQEKKIVSQVYWVERGRAHSFVLEDHLTNW